MLFRHKFFIFNLSINIYGHLISTQSKPQHSHDTKTFGDAPSSGCLLEIINPVVVSSKLVLDRNMLPVFTKSSLFIFNSVCGLFCLKNHLLWISYTLLSMMASLSFTYCIKFWSCYSSCSMLKLCGILILLQVLLPSNCFDNLYLFLRQGHFQSFGSIENLIWFSNHIGTVSGLLVVQSRW